jgi:hypothetical protein
VRVASAAAAQANAESKICRGVLASDYHISANHEKLGQFPHYGAAHPAQ